ncbi:MAG: nitric oxide reductase activation protein NorD [Myxococcota bacterium]
MDPGEAIFKGMVRLWRRVRGVREPPGPAAAFLEHHRARLELLSALLSGEVLELKPAEDAGGVAGSALLLPRHIDAYDEAPLNEEAYVYRIAYATISRELGFHLPEVGRDPHARALATLLAVPATRAALRAQYPAAGEMEKRLFPLLRARRPPPDPSTVGGVLEALVQRRLGADAVPWEKPPDAVASWLEEACALAPERSEEVGRHAASLLPRLQKVVRSARGDVPSGVVLWGQLLPAPRAAAPEEEADHEPGAETAPGERNVIELDRTIRLRRQKMGRREDKPLFHVFEKLETADDYGGESATPDAAGDVRQMEDALRDLSLGTAVRTDEDPRNLVRAEVLTEPGGLEVRSRAATAPRVFRYPEWDFKKGRYRENWCTVVEERIVAGEGAEGNLAAAGQILKTQRRHVDDIRGHLLRALVKRQVRNRQLEGPDVDVEAIVERHADLAAGHTPPERLYLASRKTLREIAILVLLDTSFSTDAWIEGRRVLDVEMQSLLVLAEAFEGYVEEEVAVASFRSHTRNDVRFGVLKGFEDSWRQLRRVAPALAPEGYTRIGAALRHATAVLDAARARKKLLLLVSDGKPTDYDRYEGRYGQEDVARAVREAGQRRIRTFGVAVEKEAKFHLARMLGPGNYRILPRTSLLPDVMAEVFVGMLTG